MSKFGLTVVACLILQLPSQCFCQEQQSLHEQRDPVAPILDSLLGKKELLKSINVTESQIEELKRQTDVRRKWFRERAGTQVDQRQLLREFDKRLMDDVREVLLPHQVKELEKIVYSKVRERLGTANFLSSVWMRERLEIDDAQAKRINERTKSEMDKLAERIKEAKRTALMNILEEFTEEQRELLADLMGDHSLKGKN